MLNCRTTQISFAPFYLVEEIASLLKMLIYYFYEDHAVQLQSKFTTLLQLIENGIDEIWNSKAEVGINEQNQYGPGATVQSIIAQRNNKNINKPNTGKISPLLSSVIFLCPPVNFRKS